MNGVVDVTERDTREMKCANTSARDAGDDRGTKGEERVDGPPSGS